MDGWTESDTIGGTPTIHTTQRLPFKVYRIDTEGNILQVTFCILDDDGDWTWSQTQPTAFTDVNNGFERIYVVDHPYDEVELMADLGNNVVENIVWGSLWDSGHTLGRVIFGSYTYNNGPYTGSLAGKPPVAGTVIRYTTNKPNLTNDYYTFSAPAAKSSTTSSIEADMDKIRVVPNPYYGYHSGELDPFDRWIQFTFLPPKCTIRVFDLAGNLVRKLEKNDEGTPLLQWDMKNEYEIPVASGIYVFHVDAPGVGEKIGKIAIFAPNERLDTY
jgi:hypothetical protein